MTLFSCTFMVGCLNEKNSHKKTDKERIPQFHFVDACSSHTTSLHLFKILSFNKLLRQFRQDLKVVS